MNIYSELSENDKQFIRSYISHYAYNDDFDIPCNSTAPLENILGYWDSAKERLFHMFGNKFILSKKVICDRAPDEICDEMSNARWNKSEYRDFISAVNDIKAISYNRSLSIALTTPWALTTNTVEFEPYSTEKEYNIETPTGKIIQVRPGAKVMRILGKIAKEFDIPGFEEFRILHSQIHNQKKLTGELCLSIHPLDYMTMSDNTCGWDSCMSWQEEGGYRAGTVEMMNSPFVVVAYLKSSENMILPSFDWNSKKWRTLFIVTPEIISNVKGYPYRHDGLTKMALEWLCELSNTNLDTDFDEEIVEFKHRQTLYKKDKHLTITFHTDYMYNDCGSEIQHCVISNSVKSGNIISINYSGVRNCMHCGCSCTEEEFSDESQLVCDSCLGVEKCDCCGNAAFRPTYYNDRVYCENCVDDYFVYSTAEDRMIHEDDVITIYLSASNNKRKLKRAISDFGFECTRYIYISRTKNSSNNSTFSEHFRAKKLHRIIQDSDSYWVTPAECTERGLYAFEIYGEEALNKYMQE